jgi:hypothetical protein
MVEFVRERGEALVDDPVKRAILQRDLWLVANWLAARPEDERDKLLEPITAAIGLLALTSDQIARLPDTYAAAVASGAFAAAFDSDAPDRSYLPPDLFNPAGPWVCVGRTDGPTSPEHLAANPRILRQDNRFTNSTFLTFLKLPAGRKDGQSYGTSGPFRKASRPLTASPQGSRTRRLGIRPPSNTSFAGWTFSTGGTAACGMCPPSVTSHPAWSPALMSSRKSRSGRMRKCRFPSVRVR